MFLALSMLLASTAAFPNPVEFFVTESGERLEAVSVEIDGKMHYTDLRGELRLDLSPGVYTLRVSKLSYEDRYVVVSVGEGTTEIHLEIEQNS